ncbi:pyridoxine/pyridoxal/pyridoxamine kinase [Chitiniphilus eburneus]|uniref:pyridoxal kinase n=1 Tax=Chitiniphilus eburneus TaxID=2571148 RepID=A0A4U0Q020_9NEIS|nr:pyridoxine/pyridoxal/pyridoxamine kinase [Chitiniphilus eburneus]
MPLPIDVISVQSQVVYGSVGNNVAMPALQALGLLVAAVPTVAFGNTPHYPTVHGGALPIDWFEGYLSDLIDRDALRQTQAVLVGYLGGPAQAASLARWLGELQPTHPAMRVIVDPVIGDHDHGIYVDPAMIDAYRRHLLPLAHGLTPNGFELECLTGLPGNDAEAVVAAARSLLTGRTEWVVVTSAAPEAWAPGEMRVAVVERERVQWLRHPHIDIAPKGTGDLFSATLTGHLLCGAPVAEAAARACEQVVLALRRTYHAQCAELLLPPAIHAGRME